MYRIKVDDTDILKKHRQLAYKLLRGIDQASPVAGQVVVAEVRQNLRSKILRPRESEGVLESNIDFEVQRRGGQVIIGIGNIEQLNSKVPYWRLIDVGGPIAVRAVPGFFVDASGQRVPFSQARAPQPGSPSFDLFIYSPLHGWTSAFAYSTLGEAAAQNSVMWVNKSIDPKYYWADGNQQAIPKVMAVFRRAWRQAFK